MYKQFVKAAIFVIAIFLLYNFYIGFSRITGKAVVGGVEAYSVGELKFDLDKLDPYIRLRYAERLYDGNSGDYQLGSYYLDLANHFGRIDLNNLPADFNSLYLSVFDYNVVSGFFVGFSNDSYTGALVGTDGSTGYKAANYICDSNYAGAHLCMTDEILGSIISEDISAWGGTGWIAEGAPGFTSYSNDCSGFTSSSNVAFGAWWNFNSTTGGEGWLINCATAQPLACCR